MQRYYITDRRGCADVVDCIERAAAAGVDYIQLREKDLTARELVALARRALDVVRVARARILVNGRVDVALAAGAHGVHLPADSISVREWRTLVPPGFLIATSCHSISELRESEAADFAVFSPIFASPGKGTPLGLETLRAATAVSPVPVFALGGVNESNAQACMEAGAAGIAAVRMFQR